MLRTDLLALATQATLLEIDIRQVVLDGDGAKRTLLLALATADAAHGTGLHGSRTLVLVDAGDKHSPTLRALLAEFDDTARTGLILNPASLRNTVERPE